MTGRCERGSVAVVVPARNSGGLLATCLDSLKAEVARWNADLVVVDDASSDDTATVAATGGARVVRLPDRLGPYAARNHGWRATSADLVVFTDARCRVRGGWLDALLEPFRDPRVAIAGGDALMTGASNWTQRAVERRQAMAARHTLQHWFLPYVATSNLAIRRAALETLAGFLEARSGGDADFCWRTQLESLGSVAYAPRAAVEWEPRASLRATLLQWFRYGRTQVMLARRFEGRRQWSAYRRRGLATVWSQLATLLSCALRGRAGPLILSSLDTMLLAAYACGHIFERFVVRQA